MAAEHVKYLSEAGKLVSLAFIGWLIFRAVRGKPFRTHTISYAIASLTGVYTYAFFSNMTIPQLLKVMVSILLGVALIILAAYLQLRHRSGKA